MALTKAGDPGDWQMLGENENAHVIGFALANEDGVTIPGLTAEISHLRGPRVKMHRSKASLFLREIGQPLKRVIQIDLKSPLPKGGEKAEDWPHEHIGQQRNVFPKGSSEATMCLEEIVEYFQRRANIKLTTPIDTNIDGLEFSLK